MVWMSDARRGIVTGRGSSVVEEMGRVDWPCPRWESSMMLYSFERKYGTISDQSVKSVRRELANAIHGAESETLRVIVWIVWVGDSAGIGTKCCMFNPGQYMLLKGGWLCAHFLAFHRPGYRVLRKPRNVHCNKEPRNHVIRRNDQPSLDE